MLDVCTRSSQEERLQDVKQICASMGAFAAVLGNGHVVAWGDPDFGGVPRRVELKNSEPKRS